MSLHDSLSIAFSFTATLLEGLSSPSPSDFYYGFGSRLCIPSPDPQNIKGLPAFKSIFLVLIVLFSGVGDSANVDGDRGEDSGKSTPNPASTPTLNSFSKC